MKLVWTDAGFAALVNAENTGTAPVLCSQIAVGTGTTAADKSDTALEAETKRIATISGEAVADNVIHVVARDETDDAYTVHEIGLVADDGTLLARYAQAQPIIEKAAAATALLPIDATLTDVSTDAITFPSTSFVNPPWSTTVKGVLKKATTAIAKAGTDNACGMTARLVFAAIKSYFAGATGAGAGKGLDADKLDGAHGAAYHDLANATGNLPRARAAGTYDVDISGRAATAGEADTAGNADTLDGHHADYFVRQAGDTMSGDLTVTPTENGSGRIKVQSTAEHPNADLEARASNGGRARLFLSESDNFNFSMQYDSDDNSLKIDRREKDNVSVTAAIDRNSDTWHFSQTPTASGHAVWHAGNTGKNSGLEAADSAHADNADRAGQADNADTVDGRHANAFYPASGGTINGNVVVDNGTSSALEIANDGSGDASLRLAKSDDFGFVIYSDGASNDLKFNRVSQGSASTTAYVPRTSDQWYFYARPVFAGKTPYDSGNLFAGVYDKSANRSQNVTYTNTTGSPMFVTIDGSTDLKLIVDGARIKNAQANAGGTDDDAIVSCIVPPGGTYKLTEGGFDHWTEVY